MPETSEADVDPAQSNTGDTASIRSIVEPLYRGRFWLQLIGVLSIIGGALHALATVVLLADGQALGSIPSLAMAALFTWIGLVLLGAASEIDRSYRDDDRFAAHQGMVRLKTYFTIIGVLAFIGVVAMVLGVLLALSIGIGQLL